MKRELPRLLLSGTNSGCGKTTVFCALAAALRARGEDVAAFKCGPDYIDPTFHAAALGIPSSNADSFFCGRYLPYVVADSARALNLLEGAMGYYDGLDFTEEHSAFDVARRLQAPAVLVVDARGSALSAVAQMRGFLRFRPNSGVRGFLLNRISARAYAGIRAAWVREGAEAQLYGYFPPLPSDCVLESRHLGLVTAGEVSALPQTILRLAQQAEESVDLDGLTALARSAPPLEYAEPVLPRLPELNVSVAKDAAFCFYYTENLRLLEKLGARLSYFSPLEDQPLPAETDVVYLGGGYPELYADRLSANRVTADSIRRAAAEGVPLFSECGGFLYLNKQLDGRAMLGLLDGSAQNRGRPVRFGYVELTAARDCLLARRGDVLRGHEFHYYDCTDNGNDFTARRNGTKYSCRVARENLTAGFPHIHFYGNLESAIVFYQNCLEAKKCRKTSQWK